MKYSVCKQQQSYHKSGLTEMPDIARVHTFWFLAMAKHILKARRLEKCIQNKTYTRAAHQYPNYTIQQNAHHIAMFKIACYFVADVKGAVGIQYLYGLHFLNFGTFFHSSNSDPISLLILISQNHNKIRKSLNRIMQPQPTYEDHNNARSKQIFGAKIQKV